MFTKSIAIIDDDPDLLNLCSEALQMRGYNDSNFTNSHFAYQHITQYSTEYLLIISDKMPKINALLLRIKFRNKSKTKFNIIK